MVRSSLWSHRPQGKDQLDVRVCHEKDFDQVLGFLGQLWPDVDLEVGVMRGVFMECLRSSSHYLLCATDGDNPVGFCVMSTRESLWHMGLLAYIDVLIVDERYGSAGAGSLIIDRAKAIAAGLGCRFMELDSAFCREDAHRFYEKAGFRKTGYQFCAGLGDVPTTERPAG